MSNGFSSFQQAPRQALHAVVEWFRRQARAQELAHIDAGELRHMADDLRVSVDDLYVAAAQSDDEVALMRRMLALHGLDAARIDQEMPALMRDMAVTCARCACKGRCASELDHGAGPGEARAFCPNADTMAMLTHG